MDGGNVSGAQSDTLQIASVTLGDAANYYCVVSNAAGEVVSNPAVLTVNVFPPTVTVQPVQVTVYEGASAAFTIQASGDGTVTYQWYDASDTALTDDANISGSQTNALTFARVDLADAGLYYCVVTNEGGQTTSAQGSLVVLPLTSAELEWILFE